MSALYLEGPIIAGMKTFQDYMSYKAGVYSYVSGEEVGGHAVLIVGFDDEEQCFLVKNSWGMAWGEAGYFRIACSEFSGKTIFGQSSYAYGSLVPPVVLANFSVKGFLPL